MKIFISVGATFTERQEEFVAAVEKRLTAEGLEPKTVGRNTFGSEQPLKAIERLMDECVGVVVIALERKYIQAGVEKRGGEDAEKALVEVKLPTPWVQVEAAMAYSRGLPLLVIAEEGLLEEGLVAEGYDWFVQRLQPVPASLSTPSFSGILSDWKGRLTLKPRRKVRTADLSIGELLQGMKPAEFWSTIAGLIAALVGAFMLGNVIANVSPAPPTPVEVPSTNAASQRSPSG